MQASSAKIFNALITPIWIAGVPRRFAIINGTFCAALTLSLHSLSIIPISLILHSVATFLVKKDPQIFEVVWRHLQQESYYDV